MSKEKYDQLTIVRTVEEKYHQLTIDRAKEIYSSLFYNLPIDRYPEKFPTWDELSNKDKQKWINEVLRYVR